jgi:uncharacterized protein (TIGR00251 family)
MTVEVKPRASRRGVEAQEDGSLVVRVTEPAHEGRAKAAVIAALAEHFGVAKGRVTIARGQTGRRKLVRIV